VSRDGASHVAICAKQGVGYGARLDAMPVEGGVQPAHELRLVHEAIAPPPTPSATT
jgi:hypothetical protein